MNKINLLENFELGKIKSGEKSKVVRKIFDGEYRQIISVLLRRGDTLPKHKTKEPITVFCIAGKGIFRAGEKLTDIQLFKPGTLITLEAEIEHEVMAKPDIHILVTKFKAD